MAGDDRDRAGQTTAGHGTATLFDEQINAETTPSSTGMVRPVIPDVAWTSRS